MSVVATFILLAVLFYIDIGFGFAPLSSLNSSKSRNMNTLFSAKDDNEKGKGLIGEFFDMLSSLDNIAEDFFYKRMGKGEIFYGKRKYKPSGDVDGEYNGFGLSDKLKIDMIREYKEAWLEEKRMRDEIQQLKEDKERRSR
mmetsp:Transcript_18334/g.21169  ORF Transcript_18334/g.21169 Transcript_18334/m.21169 type:complete len:141 (+) Transcript_18334:184-606(+)